MRRAEGVPEASTNSEGLKASDVNSHWHEIVRIGNTQMMVTTTGTNRAGCTIRNQEMLQSTHNCENRNPSWE